MVNVKDNPVELATISFNIEDTIEHLQELLNNINKDSELDEDEFKINVAHIYAHINRILNSRNHVGEISDKQFEEYSKFPKDVKFTGC